ncbi:HigA family addiction module antitoxin [Candidatus Palauibacter sp.]|uniref:HigA family addiction module antitoxin n=1 Tax=Candidatus Palauibacter sp. TaxID=3101350 RepID=UPI003B5AE06D
MTFRFEDGAEEENTDQWPCTTRRTRAAKGLGVTRQAFSELVNGRTGISVEMAMRLSKAFGSTPETWLGMQMAYDLWQARDRASELAVERFVAV